MRIFLPLFVFGLFSLPASAQDVVDTEPGPDTPRQKIVDEITEKPASNLVIELRGLSGTEEIVEIEKSEPASESIEIESDPMEAEDDIELKSEGRDKQASPLVPFYISAGNYLAQRGGEKHDQMVLDYEVTTGSLDNEGEALSENVRLILGPDYASIEGPKSQKIYDFKLNRFLEIRPIKTLENETETILLFDNNSLYAKAYRNIATVRQATQNGEKRRIKISEEQEIDSFWLESSMSWAAVKPEISPKIKSTKSSLLAIWDDVSVVSSSFETDSFENEMFKNSFFAFAHHVWPIHPQILVDFYAYDSPPQKLELVSFGPAYPKGQKQKWTLNAREMSHSVFPLPTEALSAVERRPISPLVFIISEAVENRALGGMQSSAEIEGDFETAQKAENKLAQWLSGQKYIAYTGNCRDKDESWLCAAQHDLSENNKFASIGALDPRSKTLSDFIGATEKSKVKKTRGAALFELQPYLDDADTPAFILRTAAMARASMKKKDAEKSGFGSIQAESLLKQALAKDPYDPHTYVGLAQVYAANGAYEQSWDIYDVLRAGIPTVDAVSLKIDQVEANLQASAPGYFLTK